jgi:hypothetical protein
MNHYFPQPECSSINGGHEQRTQQYEGKGGKRQILKELGHVILHQGREEAINKCTAQKTAKSCSILLFLKKENQTVTARFIRTCLEN